MVWNLPHDCSLIGVIDLRGGIAVHAIAGDRENYQPIALSGGARGDALELIQHYQRLDVSTFYVADLDRLMGGATQWDALRRCLATGHSFWLDLGLRTPEELEQACQKLDCQDQVTWIVATESMASVTDWGHWRRLSKTMRLALGIDLRAGELLGWMRSLEQVAETMVRGAFDRCVVLDLAAVGTGNGPKTISICQHLKALQPDIEIASGGGVRSEADAMRLYEAGCRKILAATSLLNLE